MKKEMERLLRRVSALSLRAQEKARGFSDLFFHGQYGALSGFQLGHIAFYDMVPINHIP